MVVRLGSADVMLSLSPDPPQPGSERVTVNVTGTSAQMLKRTSLRFASHMPSMHMAGNSGSATTVSNRPGQWTFDLPMAMATEWAVTLNFSGGVKGATTFAFNVGGATNAGDAMPGMATTNGSPWKIAAFAFAILFVLAALAAWNIATSRRSSAQPQWLNGSAAVLAVVAILVILGIALLQNKFGPPAMDMSAMSAVKGSAPLPVRLATVGGSPGGSTISAPGIVAAFLTQEVSARTPGVISAVNVYNGDRVLAGQVVASVSQPDLAVQAQSALAAARSDYSSATAAMIEARHHAPNELSIAQADARSKAAQARYWRNELQREKMLLDNGAVSTQEYQSERAQAAAALSGAESAQHQVADAQANIEMTRAQADAALAKASSSSSAASAQSILAGYTTLTAPNDGVVVTRLVDPGSYVAVGTPILRIAVVGKVRIQANVAQEDLNDIKVGTPLDATVDGLPIIHAAVTAVQPASDATAHTAMIEAVVSNRNGRLRPGTYARVILRPRDSYSASGTTLPSSAVLGSGEDAVVWTDVNGTAHRVNVTVLSDDGSTARVKGAVKRGDRIVTEGGLNLQEGMTITEARS